MRILARPAALDIISEDYCVQIGGICTYVELTT
jgi:hypothetical protein